MNAVTTGRTADVNYIDLTAASNGSDLSPGGVRGILAYADDELMSSHTLMHLCDLAGPAMEPLIAMLSYAQDDTGHALLWYHAASDKLGKSPDQLVFERDPAEFLCSPLTQFESSDWPVVVAKNYLYKSADVVRQEALAESCELEAVRSMVSYTLDEDRFHEMFWSSWVTQLLEWGGDSANRLLAGVRSRLVDVPSVFDLGELLPSDATTPLLATWADRVSGVLQVSVDVDASDGSDRGPSDSGPGGLIANMQSVHRSFPGATW